MQFANEDRNQRQQNFEQIEIKKLSVWELVPLFEIDYFNAELRENDICLFEKHFDPEIPVCSRITSSPLLKQSSWLKNLLSHYDHWVD